MLFTDSARGYKRVSHSFMVDSMMTEVPGSEKGKGWWRTWDCRSFTPVPARNRDYATWARSGQANVGRASGQMMQHLEHRPRPPAERHLTKTATSFFSCFPLPLFLGFNCAKGVSQTCL